MPLRRLRANLQVSAGSTKTCAIIVSCDSCLDYRRHNLHNYYMEQVIERDIFTQTVEPMIQSAKKSGATARSLSGAFIEALANAYGDVDLKEASAAVGFILLLAQEGGSVNAKNAAKLYGGPNNYSEEAVRKAARNGQVIAIHDGNDNLHFPVWQFSPRGGTLPGLKETLAILASRAEFDDLVPATFFLNKTARLEGLSPIEALRLGGEDMVKAVKQLAIESAE
jgi:hypothetical protein